jgi:hypothetical protein
VVERRWRSNGGELPRGSAAARGALAAPRERDRRERRLHLEKHRAMMVLTINGAKRDGGNVGVNSDAVATLRLGKGGMRWLEVCPRRTRGGVEKKKNGSDEAFPFDMGTTRWGTTNRGGKEWGRGVGGQRGGRAARCSRQ